MGCSGCLLTEKEKQQAIETASLNAKKHAIDNQKLVVVYWLNENTPGYMEAEAAKAAGIRPIKFISHLQPNANGDIH